MISAEEFLRRHPVDSSGMIDGPRAGNAGGPVEHAPTVGDDSETGSAGGDRDDRRHGGPRRSRPSARSSWGARDAEDPLDADACREAALRLLDAAPRSSGALRERLSGRGYDADVVEAVIVRLQQVRLIDDEAYARSAVRYCASRLMGGKGALMELSRCGVERSMAQRVVAQAESEGVFEDAAWELGRRYAAKTEGMDSDRRRRRFWSAGGRKGHSPDVLRRVAQELL